jgi:phage-related minor tail protein
VANTLEIVIKATDKASSEIRGISKGIDSLGSAATAAFKVVAIGAAAAVTAIVAIGGAAIAASIKVDNAFDAIAVGTGAVGAEMATLEADFKTMLGNFVGTPEQLSAVMVELNSRLDLSGEALQKLALPMAEMARMMGIDAA